MRPLLTAVLIGTCLLGASGALAASQRPEGTPPSPLQVHYTLYAGGLGVVAVDVTYLLTPDHYEVHAAAETRGLWKSLVPWRNLITARGTVDDRGIHARTARYDDVWRDKPKTVEMDFQPDGSVASRAIPPQKQDGRTEATAAQKRGTMDPLSAVIAVLERVGARGSAGCQGKIPAFDGRRVYNLVLDDKGEEVLVANRYSLFAGPARRCEVTFEPVAGFPLKEQRAGFWNARDNADKRNPLVIWMARLQPGQPLLPVRVQSTVQLGTLIAHIRRVDSPEASAAEPPH